MSTISWKKLGSPTEPGDVRVEGLGMVKVEQSNIDDVKSVGGNPAYGLIEATSKEDRMRAYLLGSMV